MGGFGERWCCGCEQGGSLGGGGRSLGGIRWPIVWILGWWWEGLAVDCGIAVVWCLLQVCCYKLTYLHVIITYMYQRMIFLVLWQRGCLEVGLASGEPAAQGGEGDVIAVSISIHGCLSTATPFMFPLAHVAESIAGFRNEVANWDFPLSFVRREGCPSDM